MINADCCPDPAKIKIPIEEPSPIVEEVEIGE